MRSSQSKQPFDKKGEINDTNSQYCFIFQVGRFNIIEIEGLLFPGFGKRRHSSSDVMRALKIFHLKSSIFERPRDVTWWKNQFSMERISKAQE